MEKQIIEAAAKKLVEKEYVEEIDDAWVKIDTAENVIQELKDYSDMNADGIKDWVQNRIHEERFEINNTEYIVFKDETGDHWMTMTVTEFENIENYN